MQIIGPGIGGGGLVLHSLGLAALGLVCWYYWTHRRVLFVAWQLPTALPALPLIGHGYALMLGTIGAMNLALTKCKSAIGKGMDVAVMWVGPYPIFGILDYEDVQTLLNSSKTLDRGPEFKYAEYVMGRGLLTATAPVWKITRRHLSPMFNPRSLELLMPMLNECGRDLVLRFSSLVDQGQVDVEPHVYTAIFKATCALVFGPTLARDILSENAQSFMEALTRQNSLFAVRSLNFWLWPETVFNFIYKKDIKHILTSCKEFFRRPIKVNRLTKVEAHERQTEFDTKRNGSAEFDTKRNGNAEFDTKRNGSAEFDTKRNESAECDTNRNGSAEFDTKRNGSAEFDTKRNGNAEFDTKWNGSASLVETISAKQGDAGSGLVTLVDVYQNLQKAHPSFTDEDFQAEAITMLMAGAETSRITVSSCLLALAANPSIQERLYKEIVAVMGQDSEVTLDAIKDMPYLDQVLKETLRKFPVVPTTVRKVQGDIKLKKFTLPADATVSVTFNGVHHDPRHYPDPERFDPDRFSPENVARRAPHTFVAFGGGPRNCIGKTYSMMSMKTVLVHVLRRFQLSTNVDIDNLSYIVGMATSSASGYHLVLKNR